jgi:hypothetical protein
MKKPFYVLILLVFLLPSCIKTKTSRGRQPHKAGCDTCPSLSNEGKIDKPKPTKKK